MESEPIQLPDFVLADLYKTGIVVTNEAPVKPAATKEILPEEPSPVLQQEKRIVKHEFLGNNQKHITILVHNTEDVYLNDQHLNFLSNILNACKLNLGDVAIVNLYRSPCDHAQLKAWTSPKYLIAFNIDPISLQLPFNLPHYQVQQYDQISMLFAPSLTLMQDDSREAKLEKSKLWLSLKKMFNL